MSDNEFKRKTDAEIIETIKTLIGVEGGKALDDVMREMFLSGYKQGATSALGTFGRVFDVVLAQMQNGGAELPAALASIMGEIRRAESTVRGFIASSREELTKTKKEG